MKSILKNAWPYLLLAMLCISAVKSRHLAAKYYEQTKMLEATISDLDQEVRRTRIRLNDSISLYQAEVRSLYHTQDNLKSKYESLLKASSLKPKDISSVTEIVSIVHHIDTVYAEADSFGGIKARLQDAFVRIDVEVKPDLSALIDYEVKDSLTVISVQKKHSWLFGLIKWNEHKATRVISHNPKAEILGLQTINVIE